MLIAVASQNFRTITGHAGKTRRFLVYEVTADQGPVEVDRLDLPKELAMHEFHGDGPHPLDAMTAVISASAGEGFVARMAERGVLAVVTEEETDPQAAAAALAEGLMDALIGTARTLEGLSPGCDGRGGCGGQGGCGGHDHDDDGHDHGHGGCGCGGHDHHHDHGHGAVPTLRDAPRQGGGCGCGGGSCRG